VQNAFGVPDTGTMLFYALCTDYPLWIFASATLMSYMSVGMVKQVQATPPPPPHTHHATPTGALVLVLGVVGW
jgi:hypothetical protein